MSKNRLLLFFLLVQLFAALSVNALAQVTFEASAPSTVIQGEQFRLSYILNKKGKNLLLPEIEDFDILFGPTTSTSFSSRTVNGKTTSEQSVTYTYVLKSDKTGKFTIPPATIEVDGSSYKSNEVKIEVLPPDEKSSRQGGENREQSGSGVPNISADDAFIRVIVNKSTVYEQEALAVTFKLYTKFASISPMSVKFPEFEGFMNEDLPMPNNVQLDIERYNGKNYYTAVLKKNILFPQRSGKITIPSGTMTVQFSVPSGRRVPTFFGSQEVMVDVVKTLRTNPVTIDVKPLPSGKPESFANAVGDFKLTSSLSSDKVFADDAVTLTLEISGTGNLKLISNPEIAFPTGFEQYDPTVNNDYNISQNGLKGTRKVEYMFIPRYAGKYTIPSVEFTFFNLTKKTYETLSTPSYSLEVVGSSSGESGSAARGFVKRQQVEVEEDIRFLKTGETKFNSKDRFFVGSLQYWMWFILPLLLLVIIIIIARKKARENANLSLMKTKRANRVALTRLRQSNRFLKNNEKEAFYEEVSRALWGYFSDKLSIPLANLSQDNIANELSKKGVDSELISRFLNILNKCEFARYSPAQDDFEMEKLYNDALGAIGAMEGELKKK